MKILLIFISIFFRVIYSQDEGPEILSVNVDGLLMENAKISSSATCGTDGPEKYCRLVDEVAVQGLNNQDSHVLCDICDDRNETKRHPIEFAKSDDDNLWWQSPSMAQGLKYQNVTVTIDLKQVYQIVYILLKMGDSPRPGNWILERSLDGQTYLPWIFFAENPYSCYNLFQRQYPELQLTTNSRPNSLADDEMFCTTYYSQPKSLNSGEIIISLINARKSLMNEEYLTVKSVPQKLINFLSARYIRFRFLKHLTLAANLMTHKGYLEKSIYNRYYYSLRNIEIGGKCICNNHADKCDKVLNNGITVARCNCKHNTCGSNCEICCPLFNQKPWKPVAVCEECNCNRKSTECVYNQTIATLQLSINKMGRMEGGGVCINCQENTEGINCEKCKKRFYRPWNVLASEQYPCKPCKCHGMGSVGDCISNGEEIGNQKPGDCICKKGYTGENCELCSIGYEPYPNGECLPCPCSIDGSVTSSLYRCKPPCNCKVNVNSNDDCKTCKNGYFNLDPKHPEGCEACYCFGITNQCSSLNARNLKINELKDWKLSTIKGDKKANPKLTSLQYLTSENSYLDEFFNNPTVYYWIAPQPYLGNWITSYGSIFRYVVKIELMSAVQGSQIDSPDVIIKCGNFRLFYSISSEDRRLQRKVLIYIKPSYWKIGQLNPEKETTKDEFISCLINVESLLVKAKYYSNQKSIELLNITLSRGDIQSAINEMPYIEKCSCPPGFSGLSCESCETGYRRVNNVLYQGQCEACTCYNHSNTCDPLTGECKNCLHNTTGPHCDECIPGFYGNSKLKKPNSCEKCSCPLLDHQMSEVCSSYSSGMYICHDCKNNTGGTHCDRCIEGYYGNPIKKVPCQKCKCSDNQESCNAITGQCRCSYNTMGVQCQLCKHGFYGNALNKTCKKCNCNSLGSKSSICDKLSGQCVCQTNFVNRQCDTCAPGQYLKGDKCVACNCHIQGRISSVQFCNSTSGQCYCLNGINGEFCDKCLQGYYNYPNCKKCLCSPHSLSSECDINNGNCKCGLNVANRICDKCQDLFYWKNKTDCAPCNCGKGAINSKCDMQTGNCICAKNVGMRDCSICEIGYFGLSSNGCKKCPTCYNGQVCNNEGHCVCPPNTVGQYCDKCSDDSWGFNETIGCKKCDCYSDGSLSNTCNKSSGICSCKPTFKGVQCNKCNEGYYGFPLCRQCQCAENGTVTDKLTQCDKITGQCKCKQNVMGIKCNLCKKGTFPSDGTYEGGCFSCFCFGINDKCQSILNHRIVNNSNYEFHIFDDKETFEIGKDHSVIVLNSTHPRKFGWPLSMFRPIYVDVIKLLSSHDLSLFYRSIIMNISISCLDSNCGRENPIQTEVLMESYNGLFGLRYIVNHSLLNTNYINIEFNELSNNGKWLISKYKNDSLDKFIVMEDSNVININVTRDIFMMALLNVTSFKVKLYTEKINPPVVKLNLWTYKAVETRDIIGVPITAVEKCRCNEITTGNHCQNPVSGYYREFFQLPDTPVALRTGHRIIINLKKCNCNGYSNICHSNTGQCQNCTDNRTGDKCQLCIDGFYEDPKNKNGRCKPCQCPTELSNFAKKCSKTTSSSFECLCQNGYAGLLCERCEVGFYGNPLKGISCKSCDCNSQGSLNMNCSENGLCQCAPGVLGIKCDQCAADYVVENKKCQSCYSGCTKELFKRVDKLNNTIITFKWKAIPSTLNMKIDRMNICIQTISDYLTSIHNFDYIKNEINNLTIRYLKAKTNVEEKYGEIERIKKRYIKVREELLSIFTDINETMTGNKQLGSSDEIINNATGFLQTIENLINEMPNVTVAELFLKEVLKYVDDLNKSIKKSQNQIPSDQIANLIILKSKAEMADELNKNNREYADKLKPKKDEIDLNTILLNGKIEDLQKLLKKISKRKILLQTQIQNLDTIVKTFQNKKDFITKNILEIEGLIKNLSASKSVSQNLIIPDTMKKHVEEQLSKSSKIISKLTKDFDFLHNAEQAKEAYSNISRDISAVDGAINQTKKQLENSKSSLNVDGMTKLLLESYSNKSSLEQEKGNIVTKYENLKKQYQNLKESQKKVKENNEKLSSDIPTGFYDIESLQRNLTAIQAEQVNIEKNLIYPLNQTVMNFKIPKAKLELNIENIIKLVTDVDYKYREMVNDSILVQEKIKKLRETIKLLRERLHKAKVIAALTHGAAARSTEPIRHVEKCVRHYVTYYLPTSNAFSLEFYMKPQFPNEQSLVLFGYDDSGSVPHAFAFTIERSNQYKFWYDFGNTVESLELTTNFTNDNYAGVLITWKLGKWHMLIKSIKGGTDHQGETYSTTPNNILNNIRIGSQTNIFIGGFPSSKLLGSLKLEGKLISDLKENYDNNFFKGCLFGVRFMNSEFGLQDIGAVEEECKKMISTELLLVQKFNCKFNSNTSILITDSNMENINKFKTSLQRKKRDVESNFDLHFSGNGYAMINSSKIKYGNCKSRLNKVLSISTMTLPIISPEIFQLIAVFVNHIKDIGFVLGQKNNQYYFGYWKRNIEIPIFKLQKASEKFDWYIFRSRISNSNEEIFGIDEICDPNSFFYLADIPNNELNLIDKLKKLKVPNFGFTGKMKLLVNKKSEFQVLATRFINVIFLFTERVRNSKFHSLYISSDVKNAIEINKNLYSEILQNGFGFTVNFLGQPLMKTVTLFSIELTQNITLSVELSPNLVFSVIIGGTRIEKELQKSNSDSLDWETHYIVVYLSAYNPVLVSIAVDNDDIKLQQVAVPLDQVQVLRVTLGSNSINEQPYYIYNLFLGQKLIDFNELEYLPPGVFLKLRPTQLQPVDIQNARIDKPPTPRVSNKHGQNLQFDAIALPYINSMPLYTSSKLYLPFLKHKVTKYTLYSSKSKDYPANSAWFDGISNSLSRLTSDFIDQYRKPTNNEISLKILSTSLRPEMLISFNFGPDKILYIITLNGQIILLDSAMKWIANFPIAIINEEWHTLRITASNHNPEKGIRVYQDDHTFDFSSAPFTFTYPFLIEIGGFAGLNPTFFYKNKEYNLQYFTGCLDDFRINNRTVSMLKGVKENSLKQCPRVLQFLNSGGQILESYSKINDNLIKLKTAKYSIQNSDNTYVTKFKFKYTGYESGTILITGDNDKFCSVTLKNTNIQLSYLNVRNNEKFVETYSIHKEKWYKIEFIIHHDIESFTFCKVTIDGNPKDLSITLMDAQKFSPNFKTPNIYFGNYPNLSAKDKLGLTHMNENFVGCISDIEFLVNTVSVPCELDKSEHFIRGRCSIDKNTYLFRKY